MFPVAYVIKKKTLPVVSDPDAQAFVNAALIYNTTQANAINTLVIALKADSVWTSLAAIYPFVGGSAFSHKWNLKDPRDLEAAYRIVWNGTLTHDSNGITPNGVNGWGNTFLNPSTVLTNNSYTFGVYNRTSGANLNTFEVDMGSYQTLSGYDCWLSVAARSEGNQQSIAGTRVGSNIITATATVTGLFTTTRSSSTSHKFFRNGTQIGSTDSVSYTFGNTGSPFALCVLNASASSLGQVFFSSKNIAFAYIANNLTDTEIANLYTAIQAFQTTLGRQV